MTQTKYKSVRTLVSIDPRDYAILEQLAEKERSSPARVARVLIGKAIDAGLAK